MNKENENLLEQLQVTEHNLQNLALQKQVFQLELLEVTNAIEELEKMKGEEVYKIIGSAMFRAEKNELKKELKKKIEVMELRIKAIEKQEEELRKKLLKARALFLKQRKVEKK
ncbi:MAG: prefoldin subunit [Candidatus Pacearchaeota archaeon]